MKIKNLKDTSDNTCHCDSWKDHYLKFGGDDTSYCQVEGCMKGFEVGAHVKKVSSVDKKWYIVPMCKAHNNKDGEEYELESNVTLVRANVSETCGK
ncbi:hypothetical protein Q2Y28_004174 [Vibrio vulnificus]|nr:hypothetical protein [Vibrio vulnificus]EIY8044378.1 hypothetical protein [Vibrio vulnificus]ELI0351508.1 hypothetical protein [Vibrio vulnificus]ELM6618606.1 hypothetical protein [Vibrio vulnificus]